MDVGIEVNIGASRTRLREVATDLLACCDADEPINVTYYASSTDSSKDEVSLVFSNENMEDRADLPAHTIIVDIGEY
jgi:hypothetical protein